MSTPDTTSRPPLHVTQDSLDELRYWGYRKGGVAHDLLVFRE